MKLYDGLGPNPKVVRMFMAEKGIDLPKVTVDLRTGENRQPAHLKRNPSGQLPTLETDDERYISEVTAICDYLEEKFPQKPLMGATPEERALTRMWTRKIDLMICEPMANGFRFGEGLQLFQSRIPTEPEAAPGLKRIAAANLKWLDKQLEGKTWITGERFSLADILLFSMMSFFTTVGQPLDPANKNVAAWLERMKARPSAAA
jgi:glutathione S-transferase